MARQTAFMLHPGYKRVTLSDQSDLVDQAVAVTGIAVARHAHVATMSPPPGIAQLWNFSVVGSKRTIVFGLLPDSLYQTRLW